MGDRTLVAARASTGPRHRCRGSLFAEGRAFFCGELLQRGLGIAAEDRTLSCSSQVLRSMLQRGLGIAAEDRPHRAALGPFRRCFNGASASLPRIASPSPFTLPRIGLASTGPRHRCRGSAWVCVPNCRSLACFNGASASLPRIGLFPDNQQVQVDPLQRGLGIAAEDRTSASAMPPAPRKLQRGLGIAAEDRLRMRGRVFVPEPSFNGASASLPRIATHRARRRRRVASASTGPRHRCRGSSPAIQALSCSGRALQRGLGIAAEDRRVSGCARSRRVPASTGPRHRCRGSEGFWLRPEPPGARFNGASASLPRIERIEGRAHQRIPAASTGPRHRCRGSSPRRGWPGSAGARFNGASASLPRIARRRGVDCSSQSALQRGLGIAAEDRSHARADWRSLERCFNGASASLPRIGVNAVVEKVPWYELQRGLGIAAEDRHDRHRSTWGLAWLQRGLGIAAEDRSHQSI